MPVFSWQQIYKLTKQKYEFFKVALSLIVTSYSFRFQV